MIHFEAIFIQSKVKARQSEVQTIHSKGQPIQLKKNYVIHSNILQSTALSYNPKQKTINPKSRDTLQSQPTHTNHRKPIQKQVSSISKYNDDGRELLKMK